MNIRLLRTAHLVFFFRFQVDISTLMDYLPGTREERARPAQWTSANELPEYFLLANIQSNASFVFKLICS